LHKNLQNKSIFGTIALSIRDKKEVRVEIINAHYIYTPKGFITKQAVAFGQRIEAIGAFEDLLKRYPNAKVTRLKEEQILYPGFVNTHVHLEFSTNRTSLQYGSFMPWLDSVIEHRDHLVSGCNNEVMRGACEEMMHSGITLFGAISSFGSELEVCEETPQRVVFFNELIGSNASTADMMYGDFVDRLNASMGCDKEARITPAIAIHAPYSVHPILISRALQLAKKYHLPLCTHLLESNAERQWLEKAEGEFKPFFQKYFNTSTPVTSIEEFIHAFDSYPTHFVHATQATSEELDYLASKGHTIAHCPRSNRYLGSSRLKIEELKEPFSVATDGLSSNDSLSLFDELRAAIMLHNDLPLVPLANRLLEAITRDGATILGIEAGVIEVGKLADFAIVSLPKTPVRQEELALWTLLHVKAVDMLYIDGQRVV
jgi:cytosine/adenosine deaminase-related metal-dependent hydrolase